MVEASQKWICVRLATYENAEESIVLSRWLRGVRGGGPDLRNTTFALLDPSGEKALARTGRAPQMVYEDAAEFAVDLAAQANKFQPKVGAKALPLIPNLRLGLNIAACDGLPLVAIIENTSSDWKGLFTHLVALSQTDSLAGQAHYVLLKDTGGLALMDGFKPDNFIYVLKPDTFGSTGEVVTTFQDKETLSAVALAAGFSGARIAKAGSRQHVRQGKLKGVSWESQVPRTDGPANSNSPRERSNRR